jgi:ribosomal protein S18 acetylase RimI-like enzyme
VRIRLARAAELSAVQRIDRASAQMFNDVGMPEIAGMLWPLQALAACREAGRLRVITGTDDRPAGFLVADVVDGCLHVEQVSVDPGSARRGLGRALLEHAAEQAAVAGVPALTLTTFADVPWNAP